MTASSRSPSPTMAADSKSPVDQKVTTDTEAGVTVPTTLTSMTTIDPVLERKLVWKFDLHILPVLAIMYLFNSLDKSNLGNSKTAGLEDTLKLTGQDYSIVTGIFFVPYVLTAPFLGILGKKYGPSRVLPLMMVGFGTCTVCAIAVMNFGGLVAVRWFLGMCESAFFPLVIYYMTTFYRRGELARRLAIFYAASSIASAFGGLLAYGVFQLEGTPLAPWRYLFLIEGCCTLVCAVFAYWYLPYSAATASFLTAEEKEIAFLRMQVDSSAIVNEPFNLRESAKIFKHPSSWAIIAIEICLGVPLQGVQLFLPVIIARLGFSTVKTNLYTVAPNISGAVMLLILAFSSDLTKWRFPFVALGFLFTFVGMVIYAAIDVEAKIHVAYFACFMMTWGTSAPSVILDVWYNNNIAHEGRRMMLTAVGVPAANMMGVLASFIFQSKDAPKYIPALATTAAFGATGFVLTLCLGAWMMLDNKKRDAKQGEKKQARDVSTELLRDGPASPDFRWFL